MKALGIGIFILFVMGLLFFTIQFVKRSNFAVVPTPQSKGTMVKTFVDIKGNITFDYPSSWELQYSAVSSKYAPVFAFANTNGQKGYFGVSRQVMKRFKSAAEDVEFYSEDTEFKSFLNEVVLKDVQVTGNTVTAIAPIEASEIEFELARQLTLKSGMPGFIVPYSVRNVKGSIYFIYSYDDLLMIVSAFADNQAVVTDSNRIDPGYTEFRSAIEGVMNTFVRL